MDVLFAQQSTPSPSMSQTEMVDWWLQRTAGYGLAFVFTACVLLLFLWLAVTCIRLLNTWVPLWMQASINSHNAIVLAVGRLLDITDDMSDDVCSTRVAACHLANGLVQIVEKHGHKMGIGSDVLVHITNAQQELEDDAATAKRRRQRDDARKKRRAEESSGQRGATPTGTSSVSPWPDPAVE